MRGAAWIGVGAVLASACSTADESANGLTAPARSSGQSICPSDVASSAAPSWTAPHPASAACTSDEIDAYLEDCLEMASAIPAACEQFTANHPACAQCLLPMDSAAGAGPLIARPGGVDVNVGGCIALVLGDTRAEGCGAREAAARACSASACEGCDDAACSRVARETVCASWQLATCAELAGAAPCTLTADFASAYRFAAKVFCGN